MVCWIVGIEFYTESRINLFRILYGITDQFIHACMQWRYSFSDHFWVIGIISIFISEVAVNKTYTRDCRVVVQSNLYIMCIKYKLLTDLGFVFEEASLWYGKNVTFLNKSYIGNRASRFCQSYRVVSFLVIVVFICVSPWSGLLGTGVRQIEKESCCS